MGTTRGGGPAFLSAGKADPPAAAVLSRTALGRGDVVLAPPRGYCIDAGSVTDGMTGGFALIASCESLTGRMDAPEVEPAVMTVSVSAAKTRTQPAPAALAQVLGGAQPVPQTEADGLAIVHANGAEGLASATRDTRHWRGAMVVNGRMVGLAVYGAQGSAIAGQTGKALLVAMADAIRSESPRDDTQRTTPVPVDKPPVAVAEPVASEQADPQKIERRGPFKGILGRLFQ